MFTIRPRNRRGSPRALFILATPSQELSGRRPLSAGLHSEPKRRYEVVIVGGGGQGRLEGRQVRQLLCTDVGAPQCVRDVRSGNWVRTRLARITVIVRCVAADVFELHIDRSLSTYLEGSLNDHAKLLRNDRVSNPLDVP